VAFPSPGWLSALPDTGLVCLFGGQVRDTACGRPHRDSDFLAANLTDADFDRSVFVLRPHPKILRFGLVDPQYRDHEVMVAPPQGDALASLSTELARLDFTVHTVGQELRQGEILDPTGWGQRDLQARVLRMSHPAIFDRDPNRLLRLARLSVTLAPFGYTIEPQTLEVARACRPDWAIAGRERLGRQWALIEADPQAAAIQAHLRAWGHEESLRPWVTLAPAPIRRPRVAPFR
jgi:tRNA nucleotidyltransferase/poly(A) polymerase